MKKIKYFIIVVFVFVAIIVASLTVSMASQKLKPEIISKSTLEKILNVSDLYTFEAIYNGITKVMNDKNPEKVDYYVSYDAKVKAGFDFEKLDIIIDDDEKMITIKIPEIEINAVNVDITSLDYMFENDKANTSTVSEEAYKKCIEDVTNKSKNETKIYEIAEQNARDIIEALISPLLEQMNEKYQLQIN